MTKILPPCFGDFITVSEKGCWLWQGGRTGAGYGAIYIDRVWHSVHRTVYQLLVGEIPKGLVIDHICRVRRCANPYHMRLLTRGENVMCGEGIAVLNAYKTHCDHGHIFDPANTYVDRVGKRHCRKCRAATEQRRRDRGLLTIGEWANGNSTRS